MARSSVFRSVRVAGRRAGGRHLVLYWQDGAEGGMAMAVSKRVGGAVVRNLVRRRLRAAWRELGEDEPRGLALLVARESAARADYWELRADLQSALAHVRGTAR
jgi:ribonuclease P protein component